MSKRPWLDRLGSFFGRRSGAPRHEVKSTTIAATTQDPEWVFTFSDGDDGEQAITASVWVYAAVDKISTAISSVPLRVYSDGEQAPDDHPLVQLLAEPVPGWSQSRWLSSIASNLNLTGACYIEKTRARSLGLSLVRLPEGAAPVGLPKEAWPFAGSAFEPVVDTSARRQIPTAYRPQTGDKALLAPHDVVHMLYPRPGSFISGLSPVEAGQREISVDRQASEWQQTSLQNRGVPDGVFRYTGGGGLPMTQAQHDEAQARIDSYWSDLQRNHKPFLLGESLDWIDLAKSAIELELLGGRRFAREAICAALGVPSVLFNLEGATYANYETARLVLWTQTIIPLCGLITESLTRGLASEYGPGVRVRADLSRVDALLPLLRGRWEVAALALEHGVPLSALAESLDLGIPADLPGAEVGLIPAGKVPVSAYSIATFGDD